MTGAVDAEAALLRHGRMSDHPSVRVAAWCHDEAMTTPDAVLPVAVPPKRRRWLVLLLPILAVVLLAAGGTTVWLATRPTVAAGPEAAVVAACHENALMSLRSPASARFSQEAVTQTGDGRWHVAGVVDSQNGFGAVVRQRVECEARPGDQGRWIPSVSFSDWP